MNNEDNYLKQELYNLVKEDDTIFEFIQSGSLDGIWYWDLENIRNEWMSPRFWETFGFNPKEKKHLSSEWQDLINGDDLKITLENFKKHLNDPKYPFDQIVRYKHKNGSTIWIRCRGIAIRDENGKPIRMLGAHSDITELKQAEARIRRLSKEYERVFDGTQEAIVLVEVLDLNKFKFIRNNLSHRTKTGIRLQDIEGKTPQELLGEDIGNTVSRNYSKCVKGKEIITYEEILDLSLGKLIWLTTLTPIIEDGMIRYIVSSSVDITERKLLEIELEKNANYDKLTELPNRRLFFERLEQTILESKRDGKKFALMFIDLDGFKDINDKYGHEIGDEVLINTGKRIMNCIRESDTVARMGGDEFTVILRNIKDKQSTEVVANKMLKKLQKHMNINGHKCTIGASIGIGIYSEDGNDSRELLRNADQAMYAVKNNGKGGYKFYSS